MSRFIGIIIFFALTACAPQAEKQQIDFETEEQAIRSISMKWLELEKSRDAAGIAALFTDDGVLIRQDQQPVGQTSIQEYLIEYMELNPEAVPNWSIDRVEIATSGDLAIEYGSWTTTSLGPNGTEEDYGKYVTIYRKVDGTWKMSGDIGQTTKPEEALQ
jgi:uncharacterized protein (TIGR02246 family)